MKKYYYEDANYLVIWKVNTFRRGKVNFCYKEEAVNFARTLLRHGKWVKIKALNESDNT